MVENLLREERRVGKRKGVVPRYADLVGVDERTIRNWKKDYTSNVSKKLGRPIRSVPLRLKLVKKVMQEWWDQGCPGWRPVAAALKGQPVDLVQKYVSLLKKKERERIRNEKERREMRTEVLYSDVIWTQDATFFEKKTYAEVIKDRCSLKVVSVKRVQNLKKENVVSELKSRELPLVYMTDNGSAYCSDEVREILKENRVIHLKSQPRTPQNNGCCEIAVREIKESLSWRNWDQDSLNFELNEVAEELNSRRLRAKHNYRTANDVERSTMLKNKAELRDKLYREYEKKMVQIEKCDCGKLQKRKYERELIFSLLEKNGLIKRYRGSRNCAA